MNIKKIIKIVNLLPGFNFKDMLLHFDSIFKETIINLAKKDIIDKKNLIVVMTAVSNTGDLLFIPVEITPPEKDKPSTVVKQFKTYNTTAIIKNTNIDKAINIFTSKDNEKPLFEVLELAAIDNTKKIV
jgi:hypothetical protein